MKVIKDIANNGEPFATYEEAQAYLAANADPNTVLVGSDPFASAVPLEALEHFQLVHDSPNKLSTKAGPVSQVRVFEYLP